MSTVSRQVQELEHFGTDHLMADLEGRSVRGGAVTMSAQAVKLALQMFSTMVLARLLTPADFGLVAMVTAVVGFVSMFKDAGLSTATVQREQITHAQVSTLFWINVALSLTVMLGVIALAPAIAWFYNEPRLLNITFALAGTFIFGGITAQHQALLRRQMRFKALATIEVLSMIGGISVAIIMAWQRLGYWSLVGMAAGNAVTNCAVVWAISKWRPGWPVRNSDVGTMLRFGGGLTGFSFLNYFTRNADNVVIGYTLGGGQLGIYAKAYGLLMMPIQQINGPVDSVMVPSLSRLQNDPERYQRVFFRAIGMLAFVGMPMVAYLFVVADDVVSILLGAGWEGAATVFRLLSPAALLGTVNVAPGWLCNSRGRAKIQVIWASISAPITVTAFLCGSRWGITGVAAGFSISWCLLFILLAVMACHRSPVSFAKLAACLSVPLTAAISSAAVCLMISQWGYLTRGSIFGNLISNFVFFSVFYLMVSVSLPSGRLHLLYLWRGGFSALTLPKNQEIL